MRIAIVNQTILIFLESLSQFFFVVVVVVAVAFLQTTSINKYFLEFECIMEMFLI